MNSRLRLIFLALLLLGLNHLAQAQIVAPPKSLLEQSKEDAVADLSTVNQDLADESHKKTDYDACRFVVLKIRKEYDQWFIDHYSSFQSLNNKIDRTVEDVNLKLTSLLEQQVEVNALPGQTTSASEVEVRFSDLIEYYTVFNERLKTAGESSRAALVHQMEDPDSNDLHIAHSQLQAAMRMMTQQLNASLKQSGATYEIVFTPAEQGYQLEVNVKLEVNGVSQVFAFSLLENAPQPKSKQNVEMKTEMKWINSPLQLRDEEKWKVLSKGKIDGMPADAILRYHVVKEKLKDSCENLAPLYQLRGGLPFLTYEKVGPLLETLKKQKFNTELNMDFVMVEPGPTPFLMGYSEDEQKHFFLKRGNHHSERKADRERQVADVQHPVILSPYEIQTTEVTQLQWFEVMGNNPSHFKDQRKYCPTTFDQSNGMCPNNPVETVSWNDIQGFIQKLNAREDGYIYRLPTEAEYEFAERDGTTTSFAFGNDDQQLGEYAWYGNNSSAHTHEVATKKANLLGLFDMDGNVLEWVQDWYGKYEAGNSPQIDPKGPSQGGLRVLRGGNYCFNYISWTSSNRTKRAPVSVTEIFWGEYGFRLARTPR